MIAMPRWAWLASFAIGCGHPSAPVKPATGGPVGTAPSDAAVTKPLDEDLPAMADRAVKLYLDWKAALDAAGTDCAAAATKMNAVADANTEMLAANERLYKGPRERVKAFRAELDKRAEQIDPAAKAILDSPAMKKCGSDPAFSRALDRLGGEG